MGFDRSVGDRGVSRMATAAAGLALRAAIRAYQLTIAPILPPSCRFAPSCSHYAAEAVALHGPWRGVALALHRLSRCHPWGGSGYDPVPDTIPVPGRR